MSGIVYVGKGARQGGVIGVGRWGTWLGTD